MMSVLIRSTISSENISSISTCIYCNIGDNAMNFNLNDFKTFKILNVTSHHWDLHSVTLFDIIKPS